MDHSVTKPQTQLGFFEELKGFAITLVSHLRTRLELLATELKEEKIRVLEIFAWAIAMLFFFFFTIAFITVSIIIFFWDTPYRDLAAGLLIFVFALATFLSWLFLRRKLQIGTQLFAASLAELNKDQQALTSSHENQGSSVS